MKVRSPLIWFGGKSKYAEHIFGKFPAHKKYVEPFGGAAHVIAQKPRVPQEIYNDIDGNVVNFLMAIRSDSERMQQACESIPYSRQLYEKWKREPLPQEPFERAVRWFYMNRSAIAKGNAEEVSQTGWRHSTGLKNCAAEYISSCQLFNSFAERMKGVVIENDQYDTIITKYDDAETLQYIDPPYIGREKYYAGGFTELDHRNLANVLNNCKSKIVISYYDDPLIKELYPNWHIETFEAYKQVVGESVVGCEAQELLLMNFDNGQLTLF